MGSTSSPPSGDSPAGSAGTKSRLIRAAQQTVREEGLANTSARTIAARAGVSQGLLFYHFGTVSELVEAASIDAVDRSIQSYRTALAQAASLADLLAVGDELRRRERDTGNVTFMAQTMAGAQHDQVLARAAHYAMSAWVAQTRTVLNRVLRDSPLVDVVDTDDLAHLIAAGFIGLELYDAVDPDGSASAFQALRSLDALASTLDGLGPMARRAIHAAIRRRD